MKYNSADKPNMRVRESAAIHSLPILRTKLQGKQRPSLVMSLETIIFFSKSLTNSRNTILFRKFFIPSYRNILTKQVLTKNFVSVRANLLLLFIYLFFKKYGCVATLSGEGR